MGTRILVFLQCLVFLLLSISYSGLGIRETVHKKDCDNHEAEAKQLLYLPHHHRRLMDNADIPIIYPTNPITSPTTPVVSPSPFLPLPPPITPAPFLPTPPPITAAPFLPTPPPITPAPFLPMPPPTIISNPPPASTITPGGGGGFSGGGFNVGNGGGGSTGGGGGGGGGSGTWCVASSSASQPALQVALDYACGYGGADCSVIQQGGSCYNPNTLRDHASVAFNSYYQKNPVLTSCNFGGTAVTTTTNPSSGTCQFPTSSSSPTVINTPNPPAPMTDGNPPPGPMTDGNPPPGLMTDGNSLPGPMTDGNPPPGPITFGTEPPAGYGSGSGSGSTDSAAASMVSHRLPLFAFTYLLSCFFLLSLKNL